MHTTNIRQDHEGDQARREVAGARREIDDLRADVERLLMITEALWTMLQEKHGYTEQELLERIIRVDMRDGKLDGKVAVEEPAACANCGRPVAKRKPSCMYCGKPVFFKPFAR